MVAVARDLLCPDRTRDHHLERGQRRGRDHDLFSRRLRIRTRPPVDPGPDHLCAHHYPGDVRPDGRGFRQRALRPDPGAIWGAGDFLSDDCSVSGQFGKHGFRICGRCGEHGDFRRQPIRIRPVQCGICLVAGGQGKLQVRGKGVPVRLRLLPFLHRFRLSGETGLGRRRLFDLEADLSHGNRLPDDGGGFDRNDDRPLDAVLPAVLRRGQGLEDRRLSVHPNRRHLRVGHGQRHRLFHHHALCRHALPERDPD